MLENTPIQVQEKAKVTQSKHAERVDWPKQTTSCVIFPKETQCRKIRCKEARDNGVNKRKCLSSGAFVCAD